MLRERKLIRWSGLAILLAAGTLGLTYTLPGTHGAFAASPLQLSAGLLAACCILLPTAGTTVAARLPLLGGGIALCLLLWSQSTLLPSPVVLKLALGITAILFALNGLTRILIRLGIADRDAAAWWVTLGIALLASAPLWLAPLLDHFNPPPRLTNLLVGLNPLTWLAILAEQDYLRSDWFYRFSPLGGMRYDYPSPLAVFGGCLLIGGAALYHPSGIREKTGGDARRATYHHRNEEHP